MIFRNYTETAGISTDYTKRSTRTRTVHGTGPMYTPEDKDKGKKNES